MANSRDILFDVAPEFCTTDVTEIARIDRFLSYAASRLNASAFKTQYQLATVYLAAHMLRRSDEARNGSGAAGPLTSEKVGDTSWGYGQIGGKPIGSSITKAALSTTPYGLEFLAIRGTLALSPMAMNVETTSTRCGTVATWSEGTE